MSPRINSPENPKVKSAASFPFSIRARRVLLALGLVLTVSAGAGCLRLKESTFDSTGIGVLWPLLFANTGIFTLGQPDTITVRGIKFGFQRPRHMAIVNNKLIISDEKNRRVLIWNTVPATMQTAPDIVLGAPDTSTGGVDAFEYPADNLHINDPTGIASDGTRLFIGDSGRHRVLVWNTFPTASYTPADMVLGQPDFTSSTLQTASANTMESPQGIAICGPRLFVADTGNHRVMVWNTLPTTTQAGADYVLGQVNLTNDTAQPTGGTTMSAPTDVYCTTTQLFVADRDNNRVLIWNTIPTLIGAGANVAVGQVGLAASTATTLVNGLSGPQFVHAGTNNRLYVSDTNNNRVMIYDPIPAANNANASVVLGQNNFTSNTADNSSLVNGMEGPAGLLIHDGKLLLTDGQNNRMTSWNTELPAIFAAADFVLGQPDLSSDAANNFGVTASNFRQVVDITSDGTSLFATSDNDQRVMGWSVLPTVSTAMDQVLGQPDFTSFMANNPSIGGNTVDAPAGICSDGTRLYMADTNNNRVLVWSSVPKGNNVTADFVLGQVDFTSNAGTTTQSSMTNPFEIYCDAQRLILADSGNNRVLIWNSPPTTNNQPADVVVGQADFTSSSGVATAAGLDGPRGVFVAEGKLIVTDSGNHRVLIYNTIPTTNGATADVVLGQPDFTSNMVNQGGTTPSATTMRDPASIAYVKGALLISELFNNRILIYNAIPTANNTAANSVFGQPDFTGFIPNNGGLSGTRLFVPFGMLYLNEKLYIAEAFNYRVVVVPVSRLGL